MTAPAKIPPRTSAPTETPPEPGHELRMGLFEHLNELRVRLTRAFLAVFIGTVIGFFFAGEVLDFLRQPYCAAVSSAELCRLQIIDPTGSVLVYFRVALMLGGIIGIPMVTYQAMMFIVPGLTPKERRYVLFSIPPITFLFLLGISFAWFVLMPPALSFLQNFQPQLFNTEWTADAYLGFVTALIFWMGVAFETPLIFFVLALLGLVEAGTLARNWRLAVVGASIAAALITPTIDPVNMFLVMGPLMTLYLLSIILVYIGRRMAGLNGQPL